MNKIIKIKSKLLRISMILSREKEHVHDGNLRLYWFNDCPNLGDQISPLIVQSIKGIRVSHAKDFERNKILAVGSIINCARNGDIVWGSGAINSDINFREKKFFVTAVRGPMTRKLLLYHGIECPEIYGDPGLLISDIYPAPCLSSRPFKLGIVPHYMDKKLFTASKDPSVLILDIQAGLKKFLHDLWQCQRVVSSSLHGIVLAEAYGIPAHWIVLSNRVVGGNFKFHDYYFGTNREPQQIPGIGNIINERDWTPPQFKKKSLIQAFSHADILQKK